MKRRLVFLVNLVAVGVFFSWSGFAQQDPTESEDDATLTYPDPPWSRRVSAYDFGRDESIARYNVKRKLERELRHLQSTCRDYQGLFDYYIEPVFCSHLASQWRCNGKATGRCRAQEDVTEE